MGKAWKFNSLGVEKIENSLKYKSRIKADPDSKTVTPKRAASKSHPKASSLPGILLTNDDGIFAKGLESLVRVFKKKYPL